MRAQFSVWFFAALFVTTAGSCGRDDGSDSGPQGPFAVPTHACSTSGECAPPIPYCSGGICVECLGDANCDGRRCDVARGLCVECTGDGDCAFGLLCDAARGECAQRCDSGAQCPDTLPLCDAALGYCVGCRGDADCPAGDRPYCDTRVSRCVECLGDANCGADQPYCSGALRCVECRADENCPPGEQCDADLTCTGG